MKITVGHDNLVREAFSPTLAHVDQGRRDRCLTEDILFEDDHLQMKCISPQVAHRGSGEIHRFIAREMAFFDMTIG